MSTNKQRALELALERWRASGKTDVTDDQVVATARRFEEYLAEGEGAEPPEAGGPS